MIPVSTNSVYLLETANYRDFLILNGGVRYDAFDIRVPKGAIRLSTRRHWP